MDSAFRAIGLEVPNPLAVHHLAERAGSYGDATQSIRENCTWHGRCWKLGDGLEIWTVLYQSGTGEVTYANCRPGFRSRFVQNISPWALTEYHEEGEALLHGYLDNSRTEVLLEVQNLTEISAIGSRKKTLQIGLCGLAYKAKIEKGEKYPFWKQTSNSTRENDWTLRGRVLMYRPLKNPLTGSDLFWIYLNLEEFKLEVLVNQLSLGGEHPTVGATLQADIWLQGYIFDRLTRSALYEGIDAKAGVASFWSGLRRHN